MALYEYKCEDCGVVSEYLVFSESEKLSCKSCGSEKLEKLLSSFGRIRIYTKEPGKEPDRERPLVLDPGATIKRAAEKILKKGIKLKEARVTGPSGKFPNQKVGPTHKLKDLDIVEFRTE